MQETETVTPIRGYSEEPIFYVYLHKRPTDGSVFYVGKGKENRAWVKKSRNNHWNNVVNKHGGFDVEIIKDGLTEQEAFKLEAEQIAIYGIENLTNQTLGGVSTTGMVHSEETRKLQREIALKKLEDNPDLVNKLLQQLAPIHERQRSDPEFKEMMAQKQRDSYNSLSDEEKARRSLIRKQWMQDEEKKKAAIEKLRKTNSTPEARARASLTAKKQWENLTEEQRKAKCAMSSLVIQRPDVREKLMEIRCDKIVVNRKYVFNSKKEFLDIIGSFHSPLAESFKKARQIGLSFCIFRGYFVEDFNKELHENLEHWSGQELKKLNVNHIPRTKAVVMDDCTVFLSMKEAGLYFNENSPDFTSDFITKRIKEGKPAMGHSWRVATTEDISKEILSRLEKLNVE